MVAGRSGMFVEGFHVNNNQTNSWLVDSDAPRNWIWSMTRTGDIFAACGDRGGIFTSADGFRFSQEAVPSSATTAVLEGIGGTSNLLVCVGNAGTILYSQGGFTNVVSTNSSGQLETNQVPLLGLIWQSANSPTLNELQGVGVLGSTYIVSGGSGTILTSSDGKNWTLRLSGTTRMLSSVTASPTQAVISGDHGTILTSANAATWTPRTSGVTNWIYQVRYLNGLYVGVGEAGIILTSPDAVAWTKRASPTTKWLNSVTFAAGNYYAGGTSGTLLTSADSINWAIAPYNNTKSVYGLATDDTRLLLGGVEGAAVRARLPPWASSVDFISYTQTNTADVFLVTGELDQRFTLQRTVDFQNWYDAADLEILDDSGAYLFFQGSVRGINWFFRTLNLNP
jgi:hypothetical protein